MPHVDFALARTFTGVSLLQGHESWSPDGRHFAMLGADGLLLGDVARIQAEPVLLLRGTVREVAWAPSGKALAVVRQNADQRRRGVRDLLLVDIEGRATVLGRDIEVRGPFWLDDGSLFAVADEDGAVQTFAVPSTRLPLSGTTGHVTCRLLESTHAHSIHGELAPRIFRRSASGDQSVTTLAVQPYRHATTDPEAVTLRILAQRPNRYLVALLPGWVSSVTDSMGAVIRRVSAAADSGGIVVETLSADGSFVLGRRGIYEDNPDLRNYPLEAMALDGEWRVPVASAPPALFSTSSGTNDWLLLWDYRGNVHAGRLKFSR